MAYLQWDGREAFYSGKFRIMPTEVIGALINVRTKFQYWNKFDKSNDVHIRLKIHTSRI